MVALNGFLTVKFFTIVHIFISDLLFVRDHLLIERCMEPLEVSMLKFDKAVSNS